MDMKQKKEQEQGMERQTDGPERAEKRENVGEREKSENLFQRSDKLISQGHGGLPYAEAITLTERAPPEPFFPPFKYMDTGGQI